jgi:hypothetical protein
LFSPRWLSQHRFKLPLILAKARLVISLTVSPLAALQSIFVTNAKMDPNAKATFPGVPPGTYYLLVQAMGKDWHLVWDLRVDLKSGANSVALDQRNIALLDADSTRAKSSTGGKLLPHIGKR